MNHKKLIKESNSIIILYDINDKNPFKMLDTHLMPLIKKLNPNIPVILVASKSDKILIQSNND